MFYVSSFWLEIAYSGPNFWGFGVNRGQISIFFILQPEKGTSLRDSASFEPLRVKIRPGVSSIVRENVCNNSKKRKKSCFFWILKKRKKRIKNIHIVFTGHLITQPLILNYRKSVPVSHQHQTSCSEIRTQETMQLICV